MTTGDRDIRIASVDFETGKLLAAPVRPVQSFVGTNSRPIWSPDGKYLAYTSNRPPPNYNSFLMILSVETGLLRELKPNLNYIQNIRWTADGQSLIVGGQDLNGRQGQYRVDGQTGNATPALPAGQSSPDGKKIYSRKNLGPDGFAFVERDLASGEEKELIRRKNLRSLNLSPDGRFVATAFNDPKSSTLLLIPLSGGEPRELLHLNDPQFFANAANYVSWMADGRAVLVNKALNTNESETELWLVPINGDTPRKVDIGAKQFEGMVTVHPDGQRIAYVAGDRKQEVWVLDNFLPH
jgi:Tol biopolymer transport system component